MPDLDIFLLPHSIALPFQYNIDEADNDQKLKKYQEACPPEAPVHPDASAAPGGHDYTCDVRAAQVGEAEAAQGQVCALQQGERRDKGAIWEPAIRYPPEMRLSITQGCTPIWFSSLLHQNPVFSPYI